MIRQKVRATWSEQQVLRTMWRVVWRMIMACSVLALIVAISGNHRQMVALIGMPLLMLSFAFVVYSQTRMPTQERIEKNDRRDMER